METMKGYVLTAPGKAELQERPIPSPGYGEMLVKMRMASICATDLKIADGRFPVESGQIMGHEFVGEVAEHGPGVNGPPVGTRVLVLCDTPCGQCYECLSNENGQGCSTGGTINALHFGVVRDGAHAEYVVVPYANSNVQPIPDNVTDEQAVMFCCVGSTGVGGVDSAEIRFGDTVVVIGQGPVGLSATMAASLSGAASIIVVDADDDRLKQALEMGADVAINAKDDVLAKVRSLTDGRMADVAIEAVGIPKTFELALRLTKPAGVLSSIGNYGMQGELRIPLDEQGFMGGVGNKRILSTTSPGGMDRARRLLALTASGRLDLGSFVTHHFPLDEIDRAYELFANKEDGVFKVAIQP